MGGRSGGKGLKKGGGEGRSVRRGRRVEEKKGGREMREGRRWGYSL